MVQINFLSTLKELRLILFQMFYQMRIYPVVPFIIHRTCRSISDVLDYKNVTWTNPNLLYTHVWLMLKPWCPHRMWLIPLMNFALSFKISMKKLTKCSTISRILALVVFVGMPPGTLFYFLSSYGTCSIKPLKSFNEQITILRLGIIVSK